MAGRHGGGDYSRPDSQDYDRLYRQPSQQYPQPQYAPQSRQYGPPQGYYAPAAQRPPRKKRRVFMWAFFAIQTLFLIWLISGLVATGHTAPSAAELAQYCGANGSKSVLALYKSVNDCKVHYGQMLSDAGGVGRGIGAALIIVVWVVVDFFVGLGYAIYRLATRAR